MTKPSARILMVGASPESWSKIQYETEYKTMQASLAGSVLQYAQLRFLTDARVDELHDMLLRFRPSVVHFCGHGTHSGDLLFSAEANTPAEHIVARTALRDLFLQVKSVQLVIFNACHSVALAKSIVPPLAAAIGMDGQIGEAEALVFSRVLYRTLFMGLTIGQAYEHARIAVALSDSAQATLPQLFADEQGASVKIATPSNALIRNPMLMLATGFLLGISAGAVYMTYNGPTRSGEIGAGSEVPIECRASYEEFVREISRGLNPACDSGEIFAELVRDCQGVLGYE